MVKRVRRQHGLCFHDTLCGTEVYKLTSTQALTLKLSSRPVYEDATAGIIFLGCPSTESEAWIHLRLLMKANTKEISRDNMSDVEMEAIISACRSFAGLQLNIPILSVFETRETKFRDNFFTAFRRKNNQATVVGLQLSVRGLRN